MRPVGQSVYDLREDEQLALAMQQSLAEDGDPEVAAESPETAPLMPDTGGPPEEIPEAPPAPAPEPRCVERCDPEWAGSAEAAGGPAQRPLPPRSSGGSAMGSEPQRQVPLRSPPECRIMDEASRQAVKRSLELAKNRQFEEAETCLAELARERPDFAECREMLAAWEAVAMCKQLNNA
ncbi:unnamed protein product [Effrenium voratum]|nr:unnamed protein product [Effrenium voratum]